MLWYKGERGEGETDRLWEEAGENSEPQNGQDDTVKCVTKGAVSVLC